MKKLGLLLLALGTSATAWGTEVLYCEYKNTRRFETANQTERISSKDQALAIECDKPLPGAQNHYEHVKEFSTLCRATLYSQGFNEERFLPGTPEQYKRNLRENFDFGESYSSHDIVTVTARFEVSVEPAQACAESLYGHCKSYEPAPHLGFELEFKTQSQFPRRLVLATNLHKDVSQRFYGVNYARIPASLEDASGTEHVTKFGSVLYSGSIRKHTNLSEPSNQSLKLLMTELNKKIENGICKFEI